MDEPVVRRVSKNLRTHWEWGNTPSTLLISWGVNPVRVRLCLGRETPAGRTLPWMSTMGAPIEGLRSRGARSRLGRRSVAIVPRDQRARSAKTVAVQAPRVAMPSSGSGP